MNVPLARAVAVPAAFRHSGNPLRADKNINHTPTWCQNSARQRLSVVPLDERRMKKNLALATKSFQVLMAQCTAANDAIKERKSKQLLEHKVLAAKELKTLSELVDPYEQALKDDWLKSKIRGNRHAEDGIKAFQKMYTVGKSELKKIANVKLD